MGASNWFGDLQLAYKYIVVFVALLVIVFLAGCVKVLFDRKKLKKAKQAELEAGPKEDTVELTINQREKDEGDLFGIRAIEAGFYAGVAQSRPTSRAGSVIGVGPSSLSTSTLVGGSASSPLMKGHSGNNSVLSLNLGSTTDFSSQQRATPPPTKLRPSEAELGGRRHHGAVDMSLQVPPSPGHPRNTSSPTFGGSDSESDGFTSPRSMSPGSTEFDHQQYAPATTSAMSNTSRAPPTARLPTLPTSAANGSRSLSPENETPRVRVYQPNTEPTQSAAPHLQPSTYTPTHNRDKSDASSSYSNGNRLSTFQTYQTYQKQADRSSSVDESGYVSVNLSTEKKDEHRPSQSSSLAAPTQSQTLQPGAPNEARLSDFYEAYYRNSQVGPAQSGDSRGSFDRQSTMMETESSTPAPLFPKTQQPGVAL